jgi:RNA polymerase sigma-70 factor (ECF subfamily)
MSLKQREEPLLPLDDQDRSSVDAVGRGTTEAFRDIVGRHGDLVHSVLRRLVGDPDLANELAQEAFVKAYEGLEGFRGDSSLRTWLVQIALNLVRDRRRSMRRSPTVVSLDELRERSARDLEPEDERASTEPTRELTRREVVDRIGRELRRLPLEYREAFLLKHVEGMSYDEMAKVTGQSIGCLKVRVHRARAKLRTALADDATKGRGHGRLAGALSRR